jgi:hypothetical protein
MHDFIVYREQIDIALTVESSAHETRTDCWLNSSLIRLTRPAIASSTTVAEACIGEGIATTVDIVDNRYFLFSLLGGA